LLMNKAIRIALAIIFLVGILALARGQLAWAGGVLGADTGGSAQTTDTITATLSELTGSVQVEQAGETAFSPATLGYILKALGQVQTGTDGKVRLDLSTGSIARVGPSTHFSLQPAKQTDQGILTRLQLALGKLWVTLGGGSLEVETTSGVAAVRGSLMTVTFDPTTGLLRIVCIEGHCYLTNATGTAAITGGQFAFTKGNNEFPQIGPLTIEDLQDWQKNNAEGGAPGLPASSPGTVKVPPVVVPPFGAPGTYALGGVCTFRIIKALDNGFTMTADLLPFESLGTKPDQIISYIAGVCRAIYDQTGVGVIPDLGTHGQVEICFAGVPNTNGVIYVYNPYQTATGPAKGETYTPLDTKPDGGLLCAPAQQTGKYFLADQKKP
jgi:FecR protein